MIGPPYREMSPSAEVVTSSVPSQSREKRLTETKLARICDQYVKAYPKGYQIVATYDVESGRQQGHREVCQVWVSVGLCKCEDGSVRMMFM